MTLFSGTTVGTVNNASGGIPGSQPTHLDSRGRFGFKYAYYFRVFECELFVEPFAKEGQE